MSQRNKYTFAAKILWVIYSFAIIIILIIPFIVPFQFLSGIMPQCSYAEIGRTCIFCGMTASFYRLSRFDMAGAYSLNNYSILIASIFLLNTLTLFTWIISRLYILKHKK